MTAAPGARRWRPFDFGSVQVAVPEAWHVGIGGAAWGCSRPLGRLLADRERFPRGCAGLRVLELGAGTGIVGLTFAKLGATSVVLTDDASHVEILREAIAANGVGERASALELNWLDVGEASTASVRALGPFDLIVGSDITYSPALFPALARTICAQASPHTLVLIAHESRKPAERAFFQLMEAAGFDWHKLPDWELDDGAGPEQALFVFHAASSQSPDGDAPASAAVGAHDSAAPAASADGMSDASSSATS